MYIFVFSNWIKLQKHSPCHCRRLDQMDRLEVNFVPCHLFQTKHKLLLGDLPSLLSLACQRCSTDPDLKDVGSHKKYSETVPLAPCGERSAEVGYRIYRRSENLCELTTAYVSGRQADTSEVETFIYEKCYNPWEQGKQQRVPCMRAVAVAEAFINNIMVWSRCQSTLSSKSCP